MEIQNLVMMMEMDGRQWVLDINQMVECRFENLFIGRILS